MSTICMTFICRQIAISLQAILDQGVSRAVSGESLSHEILKTVAELLNAAAEHSRVRSERVCLDTCMLDLFARNTLSVRYSHLI
jgi:hypothetical protein